MRLAQRHLWLGAGLLAFAAAFAVAARAWPWGSSPSSSLAGIVRSADGLPLAAARVCASRSSWAARRDLPIACTHSDVNGRYALSELEPDRYVVAAAAEGYAAGAARGASSVLLTEGDQQTGLDIELAAGGARVSGSVRRADGTPIARARLRVARFESPRLELELMSDEHGAFSVSMPKGAFAIGARAKGLAPTDSYGIAPAPNTELVLVPASGLRGRVVRAASGEPIADVEVRAVSNAETPRITWATSDTRGDFAFSDLASGSYVLVASGSGVYGEHAQAIELGSAEEHAELILIEGHPAFELHGHVQIEKGAPCPEGYVLLGEPDPTQPLLADEEQDDQSENVGFGPEQYAAVEMDGAVRFFGVPPGRYFASVQCPGYALQRGPVLLQLPRDARRELVWTMQSATRLTARVVDQRGAAVAGARIAISWPARDGRRVLSPAITGEDGSAEFIGPVCGDCQLMPADNFEAHRPVPFEISPNRLRGQATLVLEGDATLELEVRDPLGAPIDRLRVFARTAGGQDGKRLATALGDGRYRVAAIPAGAYVVIADDGVNATQLLWGSDAMPIAVASGATLRGQSVLARPEDSAPRL